MTPLSGAGRALLAAATVLASCLVAASPASAEPPPARSVEPACPAAEVGPSRYDDVPDSSTFALEIGCVTDHEIAYGYDARRYAPEAPVTRRQMALFLDRFRRGIPIRDFLVDGHVFADLVGERQEVRDAVAQLRTIGVVTGVSDDRYDPDGLVTRAQMATFLHRLQYAVETAVLTTLEPIAFPTGEYDDVFRDDDGSVHEAAIDGLAANGLVQGVEPGIYAPGRPVTRGQMAAFLARHLSYLITERDAIGSAYDDPVRVRGDAQLDWSGTDQYRGGFLVDPPGDAPPVVVRPDPNDSFTFGEFEDRTSPELYELMSGLVPDLLDVVYRRWALQRSEFTVVVDRVDAPQFALASPAGDAVDLYVDAYAGVEALRERGDAGPDGACRTGDDAPLEADGEVELTADGEPVRDADLEPDDCYRYTLTRVSPWTPEQGRASTVSNVVRPGDPDRTGPALVDVVRESDESLRLVFSEPVVATGAGQVIVLCQGGGAYTLPAVSYQQAGDDVVAAFDGLLEPCYSASVSSRTVRDAAGNGSQEGEMSID